MADIDKSLFDLVGDDDSPDPNWLSYPIVMMHLNDGTFHADVINHYKGRLNENDVMTDSHETTHMINNDIRNAQGGRVNAFYVGESKAIVLPEPNIRKSAVAAYVPRSLQAYRFSQYVTGQTEWDDRVLYLYDEFIAYINGGRTGVDMVERGLYHDSWTDGVSGSLEFSIYSTAVVMAVSAGDSDYIQQNPQFVIATNWLLRQAHTIYLKGSVMDQFKWDKQDALLASWKESPDAADMREFMKSKLDTSWIS
jgi:hypothetical protein